MAEVRNEDRKEYIEREIRYIDTNKFIDWLDIGHLRSPSEKCLSELNVKKMIELQPTADVAEVVRCKDCKRFEKASVEGCGYCMAVPYAKLIMETDFCSDGERRE